MNPLFFLDNLAYRPSAKNGPSSVLRGALLIGLCILCGSFSVQARNIDLATAPPRTSVQLTIYNSEDLTLVRETRSLSFKKGRNTLQFSWANTLIDPTSVQLVFLEQAQALNMVETTYPHDKPQLLMWQVDSSHEGDAAVEISYFTSGISWRADYQAIANPEQTQLRLESFIRIDNQSGEDYENAQVRLVVGTLNLVEEIATLAQPTPPPAPREEPVPQARLRKAMRELSATRDSFLAATEAIVDSQPKAVAKESVSEYFLYTIEGHETITNAWSKRMRSFLAEAVPFTVEYRYRPQQYGDGLYRFYLFKNDTDSHLGLTPLPEGQVQVLQATQNGDLRYLAQESVKYSPIGERVEWNVGVDAEVIFETLPQRHYRDNLWLKLHGADVYRKVEGLNFQVDVRSTVAGWDEHTVYARRIRNYTPHPIHVAVREPFSGDIVFRSALQATLYDYRTVEYQITIPAETRKIVNYEVLARQGRNARNQLVELQKFIPTP